MYPHRIRLRGPWEWHRGEKSGRLVLPGELPTTEPTRFRRRFGYPGTIDAHERVWLLLDGGRVSLNGEPLGEGTAFDVTALLRPRNEVVVEVEAATPGAVALEVRATAYLADVRWDGETVTGRVVGEAAGPLDLYLIVGRHTAAQASVRATPSDFRLQIADCRLKDPGEPEGLSICNLQSAICNDQAVRVELVNGAVIWYSIPLSGP